MNLIYSEAELHIRSLEAHADAEHTRRLGFIQQSTSVLINQMNTEMTVFKSEAEQYRSSLLRSELISHEEKQSGSTTHLPERSIEHTDTPLPDGPSGTTNYRQRSFVLRSMRTATTLLEYLAERFEEENAMGRKTRVIIGL